MQFLKKNYEKILLGLVLIGLMVVAVAVLLMVASEKAAQAERRKKVFDYEAKELAKPDVTMFDDLAKRAGTPILLNLTEGGNNRLFNPVRWQKDPGTGKVFPNPAGEELRKVRITRITPLYMTIALESVATNLTDSGARYIFSISRDQVRGVGAIQTRKGPSIYLSKGESRDPLKLVDVKGPAAEPTEVILELADMKGELISAGKNKPYKRAESYVVDFTSSLDRSPFVNRRDRDHDPAASRVNVGGTEYVIVNISSNEVTFMAPTGKKTAVPFNPTPQEPQ